MESTNVVSPMRLPRSSETCFTAERVTSRSFTLFEGELRQTIGLPRLTNRYGEMGFPEEKAVSPLNRAFSAASELSQNSKLTLRPFCSQIPALSITSQIGR